MSEADAQVAARFPWPLMLVGPKDDLICNGPLRSLLNVDDITLLTLLARFEIRRSGDARLPEADLPWRRAARGESFVDEEVWFDRRTKQRRYLVVRGQPWEGMALVAFDDLAQSSFALRRADLVGSIAAALLRSDDPAGVAQAIIHDVARALGAEAVFLLDVHPNARGLRLLASLGLSEAAVEDHQVVSLDMPNLLALAARTRSIQEAEDIEILPEADFGGTRRLLDLGLRSAVALPLIAGHRLVGVLGLAWRHPGQLDKLERRTLNAVAAACALGLRQAEYRIKERRELERLRTLREAGVSLHEALPLRDLLQQLVERACEMTRARYGALGVLNPDRDGLSDFVYVGVSADTARAIGHLPEGRGLLGAVIRERRAVRCPDLQHDPRSVGFPPGHPPMRSFLGLPLRIGREVFGNFYLCDKDGGVEFSEEDELMLELFATQSALAVGYARQQHLTEEAHGQVDRLRDEFSALIAHDLRNPVSAIVMQVDTILARADGAQEVPVAVSSLERIRRSARRVAQMTADLLDAARIDVGKLSVAPKALDVAALVGAVLSQMAPTLGGHPVSLELEGELGPVLADPARLEQVLTNLIENAVKFSPAGAGVEVSVQPVQGGATITIADRGPGLAAEDVPKVFDRFYQASRGRARGTGMGLGLYIAKGLVEAIGGRIWVDSEPGRGSRFHVWIPGAPRDATHPGHEAHPR